MTGCEVCADAVAFNGDELVLVERLTEPEGLALPGGRLEPGESLEECAVREFEEETGMTFTPGEQLGTYDEPGRDPRGRKLSTVYVGQAYGEPEPEAGKTRVVQDDLATVLEHEDEFVFDHYDILQDAVDERIQQEQAGTEVTSMSGDYFLVYGRDPETETGSSYDYETHDRKLFDDHEAFDRLDEARRAYAENADGILAELVPEQDPDADYLTDDYVVAAEFRGKYQSHHYDGSSTRLTTYDAVQCEPEEVAEVAEMLSDEDPRELKVGRVVSLLGG